MFNLLSCRHSGLFWITWLGIGAMATTVQAQSITSADTVTTVQQTGNQFQIDGGNLSGDSATLFHSFDQFGLLTNESAQFDNPDNVKNIIGRVMGGDASIIDGLLSVDGSADLYLLNPSGVFLGENTQLNLSGSFSITTATGLIFDNELFDILGNNDVGQLSGAPTGYVFGANQASSIVNFGDLSVSSGSSLTLLGGQVINTGSLSAPGGEILAMAVPGENLVRLSATGSLLGLELETIPNNFAQSISPFSVSTVPALLTGASNLGMATDITINPDGTLSLTGAALQVPLDGDTIVVNGQLEADSGNIGILGDQIALIGANIDVSGDSSGGTVLIGGDQLGQGSVPNATATVIDQNSVVQADARDSGNGGKIVAWGNDLLSSAGQLFARGGLNGGDGGFIETSSLGQLNVVTAPNVSAENGLGGLWLLDPPNIRIVEGDGLINITEGNPFDASDFLAEESILGVDVILATLTGGGNVEVRTTRDTPGDGNITLETPLDYDQAPGTLSLVAQGDITLLEDIFDSDPGAGGFSIGSEVTFTEPDSLDLNLVANDGISNQGGIITNGGEVSLISPNGDIDAGSINTEGDFTAGGIAIQANGDIFADELSSSGGNILLESQQGSIELTAPLAEAASISSLGGDIILRALQGTIEVAEFISTSSFSEGAAGDVTIEAQDFIEVAQIFADAFDGDGGQVTLESSGDILFGAISTISDTGTGGDVIIDASSGDVRGTDVISFFPPGSSSEFGEFIPIDTDLELPEFEPEFEIEEPLSSEELSATIVTAGFTAGGTITVTHGGGNTIPFDLGDASISGTEGSLTTGTTTLADGNPNEPFLGSFDAGDIQIITTDGPPLEEPPTSEDPPPILEELPEIEACITDCQTDTNVSQEPELVRGATNPLSTPEVVMQRFEEKLTTEVGEYLKSGLAEGESLPTYNGQSNQVITSQSLTVADLPTAQDTLLRVQGQTGQRPALIYAVFGADDTGADVLQSPKPSDPLELLLITADGTPKYIRLSATRQEVLKLAQRFRRQVANPSRVVGNTYLRPAQQLYDLLIAPLAAELEAQNIDTISFITDAGLRSVPLAALHDGENFIIENYNVGLMPSLSLTDLTYQDLSNVSALVAGTSAFANQSSLPGVPVELNAISSEWRSTVLQGDAFSLTKLTMERQQSPYGIIHLATHGEFNVGDLSKSYLYLHNERLKLDQLRTLGLNRPAVELLTLSACQTALGNRSAELGFAGFAVLAGAKTSVASLWNVSDQASAGLMIEFYRQLQENQPIIKAEALREAQLAMLRGEIFVDGDRLNGVTESRQLPAELAANGQVDFSHPYYWSAFSLVGSPW